MTFNLAYLKQYSPKENIAFLFPFQASKRFSLKIIWLIKANIC